MEKGRWPQVSGWPEMGRGDLALAPLAKKGGFPLGKARYSMERALEKWPLSLPAPCRDSQAMYLRSVGDPHGKSLRPSPIPGRLVSSLAVKAPCRQRL